MHCPLLCVAELSSKTLLMIFSTELLSVGRVDPVPSYSLYVEILVVDPLRSRRPLRYSPWIVSAGRTGLLSMLFLKAK